MERSLVPIESASEDLKEQLLKIQKEKFEGALKNLVTGVTPKDVVFQRPARGGIQVDYVPGWWFITQLNALFSYNWDFEILDQNIGQKQVWVKGKLIVRGADGLVITKTAFGGSDIKFYTEKADKAGQIIDIGDDLKSAATDAMKKAATLLGFAPDIYGQREVLEQTGPSRAHLNTLYSVGEKAGLTKDQVDDYVMKKYSKEPKELEVIAVLGLIQELRSKGK